LRDSVERIETTAELAVVQADGAIEARGDDFGDRSARRRPRRLKDGRYRLVVTVSDTRVNNSSASRLMTVYK
jgi:hypothetical protein